MRERGCNSLRNALTMDRRLLAASLVMCSLLTTFPPCSASLLSRIITREVNSDLVDSERLQDNLDSVNSTIPPTDGRIQGSSPSERPNFHAGSFPSSHHRGACCQHGHSRRSQQGHMMRRQNGHMTRRHHSHTMRRPHGHMSHRGQMMGNRHHGMREAGQDGMMGHGYNGMMGRGYNGMMGGHDGMMGRGYNRMMGGQDGMMGRDYNSMMGGQDGMMGHHNEMFSETENPSADRTDNPMAQYGQWGHMRRYDSETDPNQLSQYGNQNFNYQNEGTRPPSVEAERNDRLITNGRSDRRRYRTGLTEGTELVG